MAIDIPLTLVIGMDDAQEAEFARFANLGDKPCTEDVAAAVRDCVAGVLTDGVPFGKRANGSGGATVSVKGAP